MNDDDAVCCKKCKRKPRIICIDGLYYAQCGLRCDRWGPYSHIGLSKASCIRNWNVANTRNSMYEEVL